MKKTMLALLLCGEAMAHKGPDASGRRDVAVYVVDEVTLKGPDLSRAEDRVSVIFARIGVRIHWETGAPRPEASCNTIVLTILEFPPADVRPGVVAVTNLQDDSINVFYSRVRPWYELWPNLGSSFLTHVFAHEISHALQGLNRHSQNGLMKAEWKASDRDIMLRATLPFTDLDVTLIRSGAVHCCPPYGL
ncbi:MAG TPA: hypothetical protein VKU19_16080 [Bryobacteraceae bacterium]|nr:hypothetical protein [Bryobacteraceae bacterium]